MTAVSQAEFAKRKNWNRSTVTRLKQAGRLVMDGKLVDVEASEQRLAETGGMRADVAERHAAGRAPAGEGGQGGGSPRQAVVETRADAQARKESAAADLLEMELAEKRGNLLAREDVELAMTCIGAAVRAALEVLPDQTAPLVAPVMDLHEVHALIADACRNVLHNLGTAVEREREKLVTNTGGSKA